MSALVYSIVAIPFMGLLATALLSAKHEKNIARMSLITLGLNGIAVTLFSALWFASGHHTIESKGLTLFKSDSYEFYLDFFINSTSIVFSLLGSFLGFIITYFSSKYLHKEPDYKAFFVRILFFYVGYSIIIFAGNLETLFIGWEILGISSFLLISFYKQRYFPVKNAYKVFSIYRIGDIGLILAMWTSHHLFHANVTFSSMSTYAASHPLLNEQTVMGFLVSSAILVAAVIKSAQLPFSSWLPRAMEGPTPSSAIFYGSLAVHMGVFLLLRTHHFWEHQTAIRILIGLIGVTTSIVTTPIARVQSTVKSQIAYASIAQIGIMFLELSLGFEKLVIVHVVANALLRSYQLLVSPSQVSYLIRDQQYHYTEKLHSFEETFPKKLEHTFYILSLKEWNLATLVFSMLWKPIKIVGKTLSVFSYSQTMVMLVVVLVVGLVSSQLSIVSASLRELIAHVYVLIGLLLVIRSFVERQRAVFSWLLIMANHLFLSIAILFNESLNPSHLFMYIGGIALSGLIGYLALKRIDTIETINLNTFHGHVYEHPKISLVFFFAVLGIIGFPITPSFIGEDLVFSHIRENQYMLVTLASICFVLDGVSALRIYARIFLGPHSKTYHSVAYKSS